MKKQRINKVGEISVKQIDFFPRVKCNLPGAKFYLVKELIKETGYFGYVYSVNSEKIECFNIFGNWASTRNDLDFFSVNEFLEIIL